MFGVLLGNRIFSRRRIGGRKLAMGMMSDLANSLPVLLGLRFALGITGIRALMRFRQVAVLNFPDSFGPACRGVEVQAGELSSQPIASIVAL